MSDAVLPLSTTSAPAHRLDRLFAAPVLHALSGMKRGRLRLVLPDGEERVFGSEPDGVVADIRVLHSAFFRRCALFGDIGLAESYIDGEWETSSLERVIAWAIINVENPPGGGRGARLGAVNFLQVLNRLFHFLRRNSERVARRNISEHYDLGNDFYRLWLDPTMTYSSGLFTEPGQSLQSAQTAKYDRLCRQLRIGPSDHVLEIGCGWGGFSSHAAHTYGCRVTGITISQEQANYATERIRREGLEHLVEIRVVDYRKVEGQFDKIVSIEMMEALGDEFLVPYFQQIHRLLKPQGLAGFQYITVPDSRHEKLRKGVDFIQRHIFPGSLLLSIGRVNAAVTVSGDLFLHDLRDMGASYAHTLHEWWETFNRREADVRALGFDIRFIRKWNYYLQYCEAAFASRNISVVQAIYTRPNNPLLHESFTP